MLVFVGYGRRVVALANVWTRNEGMRVENLSSGPLEAKTDVSHRGDFILCACYPTGVCVLFFPALNRMEFFVRTIRTIN